MAGFVQAEKQPARVASPDVSSVESGRGVRPTALPPEMRENARTLLGADSGILGRILGFSLLFAPLGIAVGTVSRSLSGICDRLLGR
jgi:hypothetical protein